MNEERKPKKLNIKKIAVVALSIIMIMATFCLSAFADNPLTSKTEYIANANNLPDAIYTDMLTNDIIEYPLEDNETGEAILIYYNGNIEADRMRLIVNDETNITLMISDYPILEYAYDLTTTSYRLYVYEEITIDVNKNNSFTAEEQLEAINEAIASVLYDQPTEVKEAFSKYTAKEVNTTGILSTFLGIGTWIGGAVSALIGMFYLNGSLTFFGYLAVAALAVSVVFLLVYLISSFLKFRG